MSSKDNLKNRVASRYAEAGVNIDTGNKFVDSIKKIVNSTFSPYVVSDIGGFAGVFSLNTQNYKKPVLLSSTDGVGTKLKIAFMCDKHDTIGIDLVAMCVNDILVQGATPLFLLDYIAMGKLDLEKAKKIIQGIAKGCQLAKCSLIGGETAEMPGMYKDDEYDLAGFVVGIADNEELLDGSEIKVGNKLIGVASSGVHSNGFSLVRKICFEEKKLSVNDYIPELSGKLGDILLEPSRIYLDVITTLRKDFHILGICHITGGGFIDNIPRILPSSCKVVIRENSWEIPPIFSFLQKEGNISDMEMLRVFNNGIGMIFVVEDREVNDILMRLSAMGEKAFCIGSVEKLKKGENPVEFI